ncbi:hypothetical protein [Spirosoma knui]
MPQRLSLYSCQVSLFIRRVEQPIIGDAAAVSLFCIDKVID